MLMAGAPVPDRPYIHSNASPWFKVPGSRRSAHRTFDETWGVPVFSNRGKCRLSCGRSSRSRNRRHQVFLRGLVGAAGGGRPVLHHHVSRVGVPLLTIMATGRSITRSGRPQVSFRRACAPAPASSVLMEAPMRAAKSDVLPTSFGTKCSP
jgi:hypothetical protein